MQPYRHTLITLLLLLLLLSSVLFCCRLGSEVDSIFLFLSSYKRYRD